MRLKYILFLIFIYMSTNAFADVGVVVSNQFPSNKLMLENHIYENAAVFENIGVYSGTINAIAIYEDVSSFCDAGYYLPDNTTECVLCDENHYCPGGENAVMKPCPDGMVSPIGTRVADNCGKIMRVGDDMLYLAQKQKGLPAMAVKMDGKIYYAQITPVSDGIKPMNINTTHSLRTMIDGVEYSIHDYTVKEN